MMTRCVCSYARDVSSPCPVSSVQSAAVVLYTLFLQQWWLTKSAEGGQFDGGGGEKLNRTRRIGRKVKGITATL